jgi:hypothetical protein
MVRLGHATPFKHKNTQQRRRWVRHATRHQREHHVLQSLLRGDLPPPILTPTQTSTQPKPEDYSLDYQDYDPPDNNVPDNQSMPETNNVMSMWKSIPWAIESTLNEANRKANPLPFVDLNIMASLRAHNRQVTKQIQARNWESVSSKLFTAYLWLRHKTENWTNTASFESHTSQFCKCQDHNRWTGQWIDLVDLVGEWYWSPWCVWWRPRLTISSLKANPVWRFIFAAVCHAQYLCLPWGFSPALLSNQPPVSWCGCLHTTTTLGTIQMFEWCLSPKHKEYLAKRGPKSSGITNTPECVSPSLFELHHLLPWLTSKS